MELIGEQLIRAPRQRVWDALNDPKILGRCIPGCEEVQKISEIELHTRVMLKVGPVRARFSGKILMLDIEAPSTCTLSFEGAGGAAGFAKGRANVSLVDDGVGTRLSYSTQASVGGKLGQIGGRLIDSSAKKMADEFFVAFESVLSGKPEPAPEPRPVTPVGVFPAAPDASATGTPVVSNAPGSPSQVTSPRTSPFNGVGFQYELYRAFWFALGVASTLLVSRWLP